jgi:hypothetical protein
MIAKDFVIDLEHTGPVTARRTTQTRDENSQLQLKPHLFILPISSLNGGVFC